MTSFITYFSHSFLQSCRVWLALLQWAFSPANLLLIAILLCVTATHTHHHLWNGRVRYTRLNKPVTVSGFLPTLPLLLRKAFHTLHWKQRYFNYFQSPLPSYHCPDAANCSAAAPTSPLLPPVPYLCPLRLTAQPAQAPTVLVCNRWAYN